MIIHVNREPMQEIKREADGAERWCFRCRTRRRFEHVVMAPCDVDSWYGPTHQIECTTCHLIDGDLFPGREREWEE